MLPCFRKSSSELIIADEIGYYDRNLHPTYFPISSIDQSLSILSKKCLING